MSKKKKNPKKSRKEQLQRALQFELYGIAILSLSLIAMARLGAMGRSLNYLSRLLVGTWDFILPLSGILLAGFIMVRRQWPNHWSRRWTGLVLIIISFLVMNHISMFELLKERVVAGEVISFTWQKIMEEQSSRLPTDIGGGMVGAFSYALLYFLFGGTGTWIAILAMISAGVLLATGFSYVQFFQTLRQRSRQWGRRWKKEMVAWIIKLHKKEQQLKKGKKRSLHQTNQTKVAKEADKEIPIIHDFAEKSRESERKPGVEPKQLTLFQTLDSPSIKPDLKPVKGSPLVVQIRGEAPKTEYRLPPFSLLEKAKGLEKSLGRQDMTANARKLEETLDSFGVKAKVTQIHRGPAVTRYEVQPDTGVKVSRIVNLSDDLALALAAKDIRIEAPIPGKAAVGIEVPNAEVALVGLRDVLESSVYHEASSKLSIALGRDISGEPIVGDLTKMPHLLVAGATGSGKSVCINGIIISLLYKAKPSEVKLMMIDPKMVELNVYNGVPHLLAPVVTDSRHAALALKKVVAEMEKRYQLFAKSGARDIERYNELMIEQEKEDQFLPYIVVIVDELADLMMVAPNDVEDAICRLAQMARAAGIHLIIATQRPSVDVITGLIKANIPSRIAFGVSSQTDSRTILDMGGAEKLLGRGDLLYLPVGESKPVRIQGSFVSDREVERTVHYVKEQCQVQYDETMIPKEAEVGGEEEARDELFSQAVQLVVEAETASVSLLQRRLRIGYTRAARLIDMMEERGIVGPYEGSKPREVLVTREQWLAKQNIG